MFNILKKTRQPYEKPYEKSYNKPQDRKFETQRGVAFEQRKEDYNLFSRQMLKGTQMLDSLYLLMNDFSVLQKKSLKNSMIKTIVHSLDTISFHSPLRFKNIFKNKFPNNAYFLDFIRYDAQKDEMKKSLTGKFNGNIKDYIEFLKLRKDSI